MREYKLLTPGPLTTTLSVKKEMLFDRCTWDDEYKSITQKIRSQLLELGGVKSSEYTAILMQGSGTFGVEATLNSSLSEKDKCLILTNGAYGNRIVEMMDYMGLNYIQYDTPNDKTPELEQVRDILKRDGDITHMVMVHCETTTGILNPLESISGIAQEFDKKLIVDAMSSFGGMPIDIGKLKIDFLISSSNKCIQGVPGFSFVRANKERLQECKGKSTSLSLDLYDQWATMDKDGKWRYTSPTHVVAAFSKAIDELIEEGGIESRHDRYMSNNRLLREQMIKLGIMPYLPESVQSPIIASYLYPSDGFEFDSFYRYVKERGFVIYPGKLTDVDTFRIGNIGEIYEDDICKLCKIIKEYLDTL